MAAYIAVYILIAHEALGWQCRLAVTWLRTVQEVRGVDHVSQYITSMQTPMMVAKCGSVEFIVVCFLLV